MDDQGSPVLFYRPCPSAPSRPVPDRSTDKMAVIAGRLPAEPGYDHQAETRPFHVRREPLCEVGPPKITTLPLRRRSP